MPGPARTPLGDKIDDTRNLDHYLFRDSGQITYGIQNHFAPDSDWFFRYFCRLPKSDRHLFDTQEGDYSLFDGRASARLSR